MVTSPTARHHRSRTRFVFALLALLGAAAALAVVARYPALSGTELGTPVPAPEITVVDERPDAEADWADPADLPDAGAATRADTGASGGTKTAAEATADSRREDIGRSLFWSGVLGLAISLAGLGLVGTRRRMW